MPPFGILGYIFVLGSFLILPFSGVFFSAFSAFLGSLFSSIVLAFPVTFRNRRLVLVRGYVSPPFLTVVSYMVFCTLSVTRVGALHFSPSPPVGTLVFLALFRIVTGPPTLVFLLGCSASISSNAFVAFYRPMPARICLYFRADPYELPPFVLGCLIIIRGVTIRDATIT